ncbi:hypothetical protein ACIQF6_17810 [Kitasatospora sp. NPDC092948]|uniref:hypothetical protein n=1 Tax=Kitasatospora sp. NPDC092948 TaxID=3364088 RepID=UPI00380BB4EF
MTAHEVPRTGRLLMSLYPARYRAAHGEDIATVFSETIEGLSRRAMLRERFDLATHALRLRFRIGPTDPAGRVLAGAAPVALAIAAGCCLYFLLPQLHETVHRIRYPFPNLGLGSALLAAALLLAGNLPWILALAFAVAGRWRLARATGALAALIGIGVQCWDPLYALWQVGQLVGLAVVGVLVLLAPSGLVDVTRKGRWEIAGLALGVGLPVIVVSQFDLLSVVGVKTSAAGLLPIWLCAVTAVVLMLRLSGRRPDGLRAVGVVCATLPWLLHVAFAAADSSEKQYLVVWFAGLCLAPLVGAAAVAGTVHLVRRPRAAEPSNPV